MISANDSVVGLRDARAIIRRSREECLPEGLSGLCVSIAMLTGCSRQQLVDIGNYDWLLENLLDEVGFKSRNTANHAVIKLFSNDIGGTVEDLVQAGLREGRPMSLIHLLHLVIWFPELLEIGSLISSAERIKKLDAIYEYPFAGRIEGRRTLSLTGGPSSVVGMRTWTGVLLQ